MLGEASWNAREGIGIGADEASFARMAVVSRACRVAFYHAALAISAVRRRNCPLIFSIIFFHVFNAPVAPVE